ncbi:hypothetical protein GCM10028807_43350 [Spirosoma daeguense]
MTKLITQLPYLLGVLFSFSFINGQFTADNRAEGTTVYICSQDGTLYALDSRNGKAKWQNKLSRGPINAAPIVAEGLVIQGVSSESALCAVDATNGTLRWKYQIGTGPVFSARIADQTVFFLTDNAAPWDLTRKNFTTIHAVDIRTGQRKWSFQAGEQTKGILASGNATENCPIVNQGIVYFGGNDGTFYALDSQSGTLQWQYKSGYSFHSSPVFAKGNVYAGDDLGNLFAMDAKTGALKWKTRDSFAIHTNIATDNDYLFVPYDGPPALTAYSCENGSRRWSFTPTNFIGSAPSLIHDFIYINSNDGKLYAIDSRKGTSTWTKSIYQPNTTPTVVDGIMYVGSGNKLCALATQDGKEKWAFTATSPIIKSACVQTFNGSVYRGLGGIHP